MNLNLNIDYSDLVAIIKQLPVSDLKMLNNTINQEIVFKKQVEKSDLQKLLLKAPTWSDEDFNDYQKLREHINKSRLG